MSNKKIIESSPRRWITKEDWDNCKKFEEEQHKKLLAFMYKNSKTHIEDSNANTETD